MTSATFRPLPSWPADPTRRRKSRHAFRTPWSDTLDLLTRELAHLDATNIIIQADFTEDDIRLDGLPRSNAKAPQHPGIIVSFESRHGPLQYMTDEYDGWQANLRAIALGLQALRAVDRYGITKTGEQYTGWRQLTAGSGITSKDAARELIIRLAGITVGPGILADDTALTRDVYRKALKVAHPDHGGDTDTLAAVRDAGRILEVA